MTTTLDSSFLRAVILMCGFQDKPMKNAQAGLLLIGLKQPEFSAADLPAELGGKHLSGAATGALVSTGLVTVIGRIKSPHKSAKGRRVDVLRVTNREKAKTWLRSNGIELDALFDPQGTLVVEPAQPDKMSEHWPATYRGRVPVKVRMAKDLGPDFHFLCPGTPRYWVHKNDEVAITCNQHGAMTLQTKYGELGVKPHECDIIEWRQPRP